MAVPPSVSEPAMAPASRWSGLSRPFHAVGEGTLFAWHAVRGMRASLRRPSLVIDQMARLVSGTLAIAMLVGAGLGMLAWLHFGGLLARYESTSQLPGLLAAAVVMEFGPISVGFLAASRIASGMAAELAAMHATEQLDALRILGVSPTERIIAPRVLACALVLPLLTILTDFAALGASYLAEMLFAGHFTFASYWERTTEHLHLLPALLSTLKTAVFGGLVGLVACWHGITGPASAEMVGVAATRAVVGSIVAVVVSNLPMVRLIQLVSSP